MRYVAKIIHTLNLSISWNWSKIQVLRSNLNYAISTKLKRWYHIDHLKIFQISQACSIRLLRLVRNINYRSLGFRWYTRILAAVDFLSIVFRCLKASVERARSDWPKELVLLRRVVKLDAMHAFSETSLWNANTWGRVGTCMGTIVRSCVVGSSPMNFMHSMDAPRFDFKLFFSFWFSSQYSSISIFFSIYIT